jgi:hypothetical protein
MTRFLIVLPIALLILVALFLALRPDSSFPDSSEAPASVAHEPVEEKFNLKIRGEAMTPRQITVGEGDRVHLQVTSERSLELHLHGYNLDKEVEPGEPTELSFDATITGRFEIEDHSTETVLGVLLVRPR